MNGAILKRLLEAAKKYIQAHPELTDKIFEMIIGWIFPEEATFSADADSPEPIRAFAAEWEAIVAEESKGGS